MNEIDLEIMRIKKKIKELEKAGQYFEKMTYEDILIDLYKQQKYQKDQEEQDG